MKAFEITSNINLNGIIFENVIDSICYIKDQHGQRQVIAIKYLRLPQAGNTTYRIEGEELRREYPLSFTDDVIIDDIIRILHSNIPTYQRINYRFIELVLF